MWPWHKGAVKFQCRILLEFGWPGLRLLAHCWSVDAPAPARVRPPPTLTWPPQLPPASDIPFAAAPSLHLTTRLRPSAEFSGRPAWAEESIDSPSSGSSSRFFRGGDQKRT